LGFVKDYETSLPFENQIFYSGAVSCSVMWWDYFTTMGTDW